MIKRKWSPDLNKSTSALQRRLDARSVTVSAVAVESDVPVHRRWLRHVHLAADPPPSGRLGTDGRRGELHDDRILDARTAWHPGEARFPVQEAAGKARHTGTWLNSASLKPPGAHAERLGVDYHEYPQVPSELLGLIFGVRQATQDGGKKKLEG